MARFMKGVRVARRMIIVPVASPTVACIVPSEEDCCDAGSGSGIDCPEGCTSLCVHCASMAKRWTFLSPGDEEEVTLCYVEGADSGNTCEFMSADGTWNLYAASSLDVWILENLTTSEMWFLGIDAWDCVGLNHMEDALLTTAIDVSPVDNCVMGWDCVDDDCVEEPGGEFATEEECIDSGCGAVGCTTYSTAGTFSYEAPVSGDYRIRVWGGGGGAGNGTGFSGGTGGGGGAFSEKTVALIGGNTYGVFVGSAAAAQANGADNYFISATDVMAKGGSGATGVIGGGGGDAALGFGTTKFTGGPGGDQFTVVGISGGGGGSSAGSGFDGTNGVSAGSGSDPPGTGGIAPTDGGNGGDGASSSGTGVAGFAPGGGGGGGGVTGTGGAGALGKVEICPA